MDSHKNRKSLHSDGQAVRQMSGHNECCSAPSPRLVPAGDICERHTFWNRKKKTVTEL